MLAADYVPTGNAPALDLGAPSYTEEVAEDRR
jgi:hypothetical protein